MPTRRADGRACDPDPAVCARHLPALRRRAGANAGRGPTSAARRLWGIGYYLVSDTYIALFSRFLGCGAYEGHAILDFVAENRSLLQPSTVHSGTHGQSAAIFGLAYLLGIELMPRIRSWQDLHLFRPDAGARCATPTSTACSPPSSFGM
jgi:TnpA family transposase